jgi:ribosome-binding factor A
MKKTKRQSTSAQAPNKFPRVARVNEVLREVIGTELERLFDNDPRLELVTVTGVQTDPDLRHAKVFFSALANNHSPEDIVAALEQHRVDIQSTIGKTVRMKRTPQLEFVTDRSIEEGQKVEEILRNIHQDD